MYNLGEQFRIGKTGKANPKAILKGEKYRITILTERLIRLEYNETGEFEDRTTMQVINRELPLPKFNVMEDSKFVTITTNYFKLTYVKNAPFQSNKLEPNLKVEFLENIDANKQNRIWNYGAPEVKNYGAPGFNLFEKKKKLKKSLYSLDGFVTIDDSKSMIIEEDGTITKREYNGIDTYLFIYLNDFSKCLEDYYKITGYTPLIPRYALGNWWYRNYKYGDVKLQELVTKFKENKIPVSTIILNSDWHLKSTNKNALDAGLTFNNEIFRNPKLMIDYLHKNDIRLGLTIDPLKGFTDIDPIYSETIKYIQPNKENYIPFNVYDPKVIDIYLKLYIHQLDNLGIDMYFIDFEDKNRLQELSILKHYQYYDIMRYAGRRPLIMGYNSLTCPHRYSLLYSGKSVVSWDTLKTIPLFNIHSSNNGVTWWTHDIGGYHNGVEDNELFIRFVQLGTFSPIMKLSSEKGKYYKREPWRWGVKTYDITKEYLQLRHRLIPYIYSEAYKLSRFGTPLLQPLYYKHPEMYDDPLYYDEYYFGSELFVSPILNSKDYVMDRVIHKFFVPDGIWYDFITGKKFPGNRRYVSFFRDQDYPVFVKMGAIIPMADKEDVMKTTPPKNMEIQVFPGKSNNFVMYEDDGVTNQYLRNNFVLTSIDYNYMPNNYTVIVRVLQGKGDIIPPTRNYKFTFRNTKRAEDVTVYKDYEKIPCKSYVDGPNFIIEVENVPTFGHQLTINCKGKDIEIDAVRLVNEDIEGIISDLQIETIQKEQIDKVLFSDLPIRKKRIAIRRLQNKRLERKFVQLFLKLLEYVEINDNTKTE